MKKLFPRLAGLQDVNELPDGADADELDTVFFWGGEGGDILAGDDAAGEAQLGALGDAGLHLGDGAHLTGQAHLTDGDDVFVYRDIPNAGEEGQHQGEAHGGLIDAQAAHHVDVHVQMGEGGP